MKPAQPSLWDAPPGEELVPWSPDLVIYRSVRWADGDSTPAALERLALGALYDLEGVALSNGERMFYRVIATGIVDGVVWRAMRYLCPVRCFYGVAPDGIDANEEDEEF